MTNWPVQKQTLDFTKKCSVTALAWSMTFIWGLNQFFAKANFTLTQHIFDKNRTVECIFPLYTGHLEYEQNDGRVKSRHVLKREGGKKESQVQKYSAFENHYRSVAEGPTLERTKW